MRAVVIPRPGPPEVLEIQDLPEPVAESGQVRVRVTAATVNPTDVALRAGLHPGRDAAGPVVPGMEAAGTVDQVGDGVAFAPGDRVMAITTPDRGGAYRDQVVLGADQVARVPEGVSLVEAATLPMNGLTAVRALDMLALPPGGSLVISGAAGALGGYVLQLAVHRGLRVVAIAGESDRDLLAALAPHEFVPRGERVAERVREVLPDGADGALDAALLHEELVPAVRDDGGFAVVRGWDGSPGRGITVHKVMVGDYLRRADLLDELGGLVADGVLTLRVAQTYPAEEAAEAHRRMESGGVRGRLVVTF